MDAQARKKALYRAKLKDSAQKREKRIDSPLVRYNEFDQPVCRVCDVILKSDSLWPAHQASRKHHETKMTRTVYCVECGLCDKWTKGGIRCQNEHLVSGYENAKKFAKIVAAIRGKDPSEVVHDGDDLRWLDVDVALEATREGDIKKLHCIRLEFAVPWRGKFVLGAMEDSRCIDKRMVILEQAIKNVKASAAGLTRLNDENPEPPAKLPKPKSEPPAELHKARSSSMLPTDFFDNNETKRQKTGLGTGGKFESSAPQASVKLVESDSSPLVYEKTEHSALNHPMEPSNSENKLDSSNVPTIQAKGESEIKPSIKLSHTSRKGVESDVKQVKGALPEGFFDNKDADLRARGIEPVKLDIKDEYKEFEKVIQEDLQEVDERFEEEEFDAAEVREEAESLEQKACRERVEMLKKKQMELKAAKFAGQKDTAVMDKDTSSEESSSDEDDNEQDFAVDWRAKHL
ncbi:hypothetical protein HHK36_017032 [Tetracentron sinense]|uniref:Coiled-coil domain-containing protein 16 n=1 Tax=Tetracentron sinense TaxID=13715 RepID=A0A834Y7I2_TETSI|nr:hypothetical protein HHK36_032295 [Tetracentron sinense]KAF8398107.1 hypothetical protein HHK36_017032 [Tetracentron sinense]